MQTLADFHFLRPLWFLLIPIVFAIAWLRMRRHLSQGAWAQWCDARLLPFLLERNSERASRMPVFLFLFACTLAIFALAGPVWQRIPLPVYSNQSALVIALDLSRSMDAQDIQPSRLGRARYKISDILEQRKDGLTALVVYSNHAFTVTPLTDDRQTIANQLSALETSIMPAQGSHASQALDRAAQLLEQSGNPNADILLITDGVDESAFDSARKLKDQGHRVHVLGIGSEAGAPIPSEEGGFVKDLQGGIVLSKLDRVQLEDVARFGGGSYRSLALDDSDIRALLRTLDRPKHAQNQEQVDRKADQWVEAGPWLLFGVLPFAAFAFRRGYFVVLLFVLLPFPQDARAWQWTDLWQRRDQQAFSALKQGDAQRAAELFKDPQWKAAAEYRASQYEKALETLNESKDPGSAYNQGNALARSGQFEAAAQAYQKALEINPDDEDAKFNRDLVEKALKEQQASQQGSSDNKDSPKNQDSSKSQDSSSTSQDSAQSAPKSSEAQSDQQQSQSDASGQARQEQEKKDAGKDSAMNPEDAKQSMQKEQTQDGAKDSRKDSETKQMQKDSGQESRDPEKNAQSKLAEREAEQEVQQANEQWLRRIPDDPGGLLRRKFEYQYKRSRAHQTSDAQNW